MAIKQPSIGPKERRARDNDSALQNDAIADLFRLPDFSVYSLKDRELLINSLQIRSYRRGSMVIRERDEPENLFIVIRGTLRVRRVSRHGKELTLKTVSSGAIIGDIGIITGASRSADIIAEEPSVLAEISAASFKRLLDTSPVFARTIIEGLAHIIQRSTDRLSAVTFLDVPERLMQTLLNISTTVQLEGAPPRLVRELPSHNHLATLVGCTREAVTRGLKQLQEEGLIEIDGVRVWILEQG